MLTEMPQLIGDLDFNLSDPVENRKSRIALERDAEHLFDYGDLPVFKSGGYYFGVDEDGLMPYVIKTEPKFISAVQKRGIVQRALWRDSMSNLASGLPSKVFFDVLLHDYKLVISDCQQTPDGRRFWQLRLLEALKKGCFCYFLNATGPRSMRRILKSETNFEKAGKIWGEDPKFKSHWLLISTEPLTPKDDDKFEGN